MRIEWLVAFSVVGCGELQGERLKWAGYDEKEANAGFEAPTGPLDEALLKQLVLESLDDEFRVAAKPLNQSISKVLAGFQAGATTGTLEAALTITSSNAYVRAACPGPDAEKPDTTFAHGELRFDAPGLVPTKKGLKDGDVLLTFRNCVSGKVTMNGRSPAYYDTTKGLVATLALDVDIEGKEPVALSQAVRFGGKDLLELLVELGDHGSYVINLGQLPNRLSVRGDGGTVDCVLDGSKATCDLGGKKFTFDTKKLQGSR